MKTITVALVGNPNSGKTTIFNRLTGANQRVGNYPGVTVEIKEGSFRYRDCEVKVFDLPGTYSLTAYSPDEVAVRDFILRKRPDVILNVIDSSNLERNLYLTVQMVEMGAPLVLVFNMSDEARAKGYVFDLERFSDLLGAPVVQTVGNKGRGIEELKETIVSFAIKRPTIKNVRVVDYGLDLEREIEEVESRIQEHISSGDSLNIRWLAIKLIEKERVVSGGILPENVLKQIEEVGLRIENSTGKSPETVFAEKRYEFISAICREAVRSPVSTGPTLSDRIDAIVTNRVIGIPLFLGLMYLVFSLIFAVGDIPAGYIEAFFIHLKASVSGLWPPDSQSLTKSLILDGIIGGVGSVLVFLPNVLLLFLSISIMEDTGYMARVAFIMDRLMSKIGLHGKSCIPMLLGFGCSVPAIMATRTLENRKDRLMTMLVIPLMSCGARLPIYTLIIPAFFPRDLHTPMLWTMYLIGISIAAIVGKILRSAFFRGESIPFLMELPPYRVPGMKDILIHIWQRCWQYLKRAGTVILGISVLLWFLSSFPGLPEDRKAYFESQRESVRASVMQEEERLERLKSIENEEKLEELLNSFSGRIGKALEVILKPMGFDWKIGTALIGAFAAKEVFVAQLGIVYSLGSGEDSSETLRERLREDYSPLTGFCIMLFCLISMPCMATVAVTRKESGSFRLALFQLMGLTAIAYVLTVGVFQVGNLLGIGIE